MASAITGSLVMALGGRGGPPVAGAPVPPSPVVQIPAPPLGPDHDGSPKAPSASPAVPASTTITLRLAVEPPGAAILLDGTRVGRTELVVPRDAAPHRLQITAPGYLGYDETISYDESQRLFVQLKHAADPLRGKDPRKDRPRTDRTDRTDRIESQSPYNN
jgi:hypothetical protein